MVAASQGAFRTLQGLEASAGTYREFDAWQLHASGRHKRGRGVLKAPRPRAQNCRSDAPPWAQERKNAHNDVLGQRAQMTNRLRVRKK